MVTTQLITIDNSTTIKEIYDDFKSHAIELYAYAGIPIDFDNFVLALQRKVLGAVAAFSDSKPVGLLIYTNEKHRSKEINVIHVIKSIKDDNSIRKILINGLLDEISGSFDWDVISYAMLGDQKSFARDIAPLGFNLIGQTIIKYDLTSPTSFRILRKAEVTELKNHKIISWDDSYRTQVAKLAHLSFKNTKNAAFDRRFKSLEGADSVLDLVLSNQYGAFLPAQSKILLYGDEVEGICLTSLVDQNKVNIPLICVKKQARNKGMGKLLLKVVITGFLKLISSGKFNITEINATTDTDNYPAVNMYRRLGFKEETCYPHSYYTNPNVLD